MKKKRPEIDVTAPAATRSTEIEQMFLSVGVHLDWRAIAVKQSIKELSASLETLLPNRGMQSQQQLIDLILPLLRAAVIVSHQERIIDAVRRVTNGEWIDLRPLCQAVIQDLTAIDSVEQEQE